jgi:GT2 family glycosyltransferase
MISIATLLTVYNRKEKTISCLGALFASRLPEGYSFDVFMVDDGSTDGTTDLVKLKFPVVNIIQGDGNLFWNRGLYLAWETATKTYDYDFYLWLNDDTFLYPNALKEMVDCAKVENNASIICGTTVSPTNKNKITYGGRINRNNALIIPNGNIQYCTYINGNAVLIPRGVYKKIGMNDPVFRHSTGDSDYGLRAIKAGIKISVSFHTVGVCAEHETLDPWCNPQVPFIKRWNVFRTPLGNNPEEFFIFEYRHNGLLKAIFHYFTNHLRVFFPVLWKKRIEND